MGNEGIAPRILLLQNWVRVSGQVRASAAWPPWEKPLVPTGWEAE
jgi:hypothetical protein